MALVRKGMTRRQEIVTEFDFFVVVTDNVPGADGSDKTGILLPVLA